jgi:hypothetical protein
MVKISGRNPRKPLLGLILPSWACCGFFSQIAAGQVWMVFILHILFLAAAPVSMNSGQFYPAALSCLLPDPDRFVRFTAD